MSHALKDFSVTHGGVKPLRHPRLNAQINGQTAIRYMRFLQPVTIERLELSRNIYGRHVPNVPTHAAHLLISTLDRATHRWNLVKEVDLPPDPIISGEGLSQSMSPDEMNAKLQAALAKPPQTIDLGGLETDHLRVECDREHPVWPNHGECNGSPYFVPFGILHPLTAFGTPSAEPTAKPLYSPILRTRQIRPRAPRGMKLHDRPEMLLFEGRRLSVGFSLRRPMLMHLGWDASGTLAGRNRLLASKPMLNNINGIGGFTGPLLRTLRAEAGSHVWTGEVEVRGNQVFYRRLRALPGVTIDLAFTVEPDRLLVDITQRCDRDTPVIEAEAFRLAWDITAGPTAAAAPPTLLPGRNGDVRLPALWAADGIGCLSFEVTSRTSDEARLQVESFQAFKALTGGLVLAPRPGPDACLTLPAGTRRAELHLAVTEFEPDSPRRSRRPGPGLRRHWGSIYACFRPEYGGFSNHAASVNCHVSQAPPSEIVLHTRRPKAGPDPLDLLKFTIGRALMDGGGYGYWRNLYLDSDPHLLCAAGRIHQSGDSADWLRETEPGLIEAADRVIKTVDRDTGLVVCHDLSGNSGSYRWSSNAADVIGFGHIDAYVNAWSYRGLRNTAALMAALGHDERAARCRDAAASIRAAYATHLLNPETGWVAGWRSRDGELHDYAFIFVNGPAIAFGLLDPPAARKAVKNLERLRDKLGLARARMGLPCGLLPIRTEDHMLPRIIPSMHPSFENYCDGSLAGSSPMYYLRAVSLYGEKRRARQLAADLDEGFAAGMFSGGMGGGQEFRSWEGMPTGYEGTLIVSVCPVYALAIEQGVIQPKSPEWWPEGG